jgi:cytochrome c553
LPSGSWRPPASWPSFSSPRPGGGGRARGGVGSSTALAVVALSLVTVVGWALYELPALRVIPSSEIARTVTASIPRLAPTGSVTPEQAALAARGRYLYTVASCALCHSNDGASGAKISWTAFGSLWSRNMTPDRETGIGAWSDREITRAIRSGVTPDGRTLHWQGMIWDHASNWDEADVRALIAYLRAMPPSDGRSRPHGRRRRTTARPIRSGWPAAPRRGVDDRPKSEARVARGPRTPGTRAFSSPPHAPVTVAHLFT